jgi:hypothetical protein
MMRANGLIRRIAYAMPLLLGLAAGGCSDSISDHVIGLDATGTVFVFLYLDNDLNMTYTPAADTRLTNAQVDLVLRGSQNITPGGVTDTVALRVIQAPVGRYTVRVGSSVLGDSLEVEVSSEFTLTANDSTSSIVALKYKTYSVEEAKALPTTRRGWMRGHVVNSAGTFGDSTVHVLSDTGNAALRVVSVRPGFPVIGGDTAGFLGRRSVRDGETVWVNSRDPVIFAAGDPPAVDTVMTVVAATADGGKRDARLVLVQNVTVSDTITLSGARTMNVSDGSGTVTIVLAPSINFGQVNQFYKPAIVLDIAGVLVPDPTNPGMWVIKPRGRADITILP